MQVTRCGQGVYTMRWLLTFIAVLFLSGCATSQQSAREAEIVAAAQSWGAAYDSRDPARIASLYAPDAILWGTTMKVIATTPGSVLDYFRGAPGRPNARVIFESHNVRGDDDFAVDSGAYTFVDVRDGVAVRHSARFTLVFRKRGDRWLLLHHHSSRLP